VGLGRGIGLPGAGLRLVAAVVSGGTAFVDGGARGWILIIAGVISLVFALVINTQHRTHVVEERRDVV
jgi:uncharacterized membrane protein HdeD (DUF308 family)